MPPPTDTVPELTLRALRNGDGVTGISLGDTQFSPLKTLLKRDVTIFHEELLARTYVLVDSGNAVRGFVTLVCGEITTDNSLDETVGVTFRYEHYPAVKIARLAVDHRYRGYGYGRNPVDFATGCIRNISEIAGCRFV
ncbi:MAG: hypothetical protein OXC91_13110, partial [Rhodobacteraceae bacterium]|nr:hypothetical protein [Paracoccaceae bacterium]